MKYWFIRSPYKTRKWEDILMSGIFHLYGIRNYEAKKKISGMKKEYEACALFLKKLDSDRKHILNPLSHNDTRPIYSQELKSAMDDLEKLKGLLT